jgi:hypothetical protein
MGAAPCSSCPSCTHFASHPWGYYWRYRLCRRSGNRDVRAAGLSQVRSPNMPRLVFTGLRRGVPPASICTKTSQGNTPEAKSGQRHQGREAGNVRAGSLASPVEWVLGLPLGFLNGVKPQVIQEGHKTTQGPVCLGHATRSRAPDARRKARHEAGYRSRICLNKRRNTNLARETRTLCPVGRTSLSPAMGMTSELLGMVLPIPPRDPSPMCKSLRRVPHSSPVEKAQNAMPHDQGA